MGDTILPAGVFDTEPFVTPIICGLGFVLDKRIDPVKVEHAWTKLITAWPLLVSRLRRGSQTNQWQYHIPSEPSISKSFSSLHLPGSLRSHFPHSLPSDSISITIQDPNPRHLFHPHGPTSVDELLTTDRPMCYLHVTTFNDGSLVGIMVPHILTDGNGAKSIIDKLCDMLKTDEIPPPLNYTDPFVKFVPKAHEDVPAPPSWHVLSTLGGLSLYARSLWASWRPVQWEWREVYFPRSEVKRLKDEAMMHIRDQHGEKTDLFVSTSDAVLAFLLKCAHASERSNAPFNLLYTVTMPTAVPKPYLRNTTSLAITPAVGVSSLATSSLGNIALSIRDMLASQANIGALVPWVRWHLKHQAEPKIFFDPYRGRVIMATNVRELKGMGVDFSGALPDGEKGGKVKCIHVPRLEGVQPNGTHNTMGLMADDENGGMWTYAHLPRSVWEDMNGFGRYTLSG